MANVAGTFYAGGTGASNNYGAKLIDEKWQKEIEFDVYEDGAFFPLVQERDRLFNKLHIRKVSTFSANTLTFGGTQDGQGLTYGAAADSEQTLTPTGLYVAVAISRNQMRQLDGEMVGGIRESIVKSIAQNIDNTSLTTCATTLSTNIAGDSTSVVDRALFLNLLGTVRLNAKSAVKLGTSDLKFIIHPKQHPAFMSIPEITAANLRGDSADPNVKGVVYNALGTEVIISGNVGVDGSGALCNPLFVKSAFGISWNERPNAFEQDFELQHRVYAYANYGFGIVWDQRAGLLKTKNSF